MIITIFLFFIILVLILLVIILYNKILKINKSIDDINGNITTLHNNQHIMQKSVLRIYNETKLFKKEVSTRK